MTRESRSPVVRLVDVDADNWRELVEVASHPDQERLVAPITRHLVLDHQGGHRHQMRVRSDCGAPNPCE